MMIKEEKIPKLSRIEKLERIKEQIEESLKRLEGKEMEAFHKESIKGLLETQRESIIDLIRLQRFKSQSDID